MAPPTDTVPMALANGARFEVRWVQEFLLHHINPLLLPRLLMFTEQRAHAIFLRAAYWLQTLSKLDNPAHFQAAIASARALLEITIDLTLLAADTVQSTWASSTRGSAPPSSIT